MRLAVFSDIHGNLEALQEFIAYSADLAIDRYVCLGDIVGYGANPSECIDLLNTLPNLACVQGNHDATLSWDSTPYMMSESAREVILWSMENVTESQKKYLQNLPLTYSMNDLSFSHANPYNPKAWRYVRTAKYARRCFQGSSQRYLFIGHTHAPMVITRKNVLQLLLYSPEPGETVCLDSSKRQIYNCGSIGQPRTGRPDSNFLVYDTQKKAVTFHSVPYDHDTASRKILSAGLPEVLARRLLRGV